MPTYKGFSTIDKRKKFSLTDRDLVKRDLQNAFGIREGEVPGRPEIGSKIWLYVNDPNDDETRDEVESEVRRIIAGDSRLELHELFTTFDENTIQVAVSLSIRPDVDVEEFYITFLREAGIVAVT